MLLRSLALRDEAMALCDPAVDMLLWKLAPINDIFRTVRRAQAAILVLPTPCAELAVSPPRKIRRSSDATCQRHKICQLMASCVLA